jgi:heterodisulfide reductase subunit B
MKIGFYPGCSLKGTAIDFLMSFRKMAELAGVELAELDDWNCCGATSAHQINRRLADALPARNLALAEAQGFDRIVAPCSACSQRLKATHHHLAEDPGRKAEIEETIERPVALTAKVLNFLDFTTEYVLPAIEKRGVASFPGLKAACYYGCLLVRPPKVVEFDDPENPTSMERVMEAIGVETVEWPLKIDCCGGGFTLARTDVVVKLVHSLFENALEHGANAIVTACPMCHSNLDMRQADVEREFGKSYQLPIYYLSEIAAVALGAEPAEVGVSKHFVEANLASPVQTDK